MDTGEAVLESGSGRRLNPEEYCADANALLMCVPKTTDSQKAASTMRPSIRRCCGPNAAYDENRYHSLELPKFTPIIPVESLKRLHVELVFELLG